MDFPAGGRLQFDRACAGMMIDLVLWLKRGLVGAGLSGLAFVLLFAGYGCAKGYDVPSGLMSLMEFDPGPVASNPVLEDVPGQRVIWMGDIEHLQLAESSGLTASNLHADVLWSINDSGDGPNLYAMKTDGSHIGVWQVAGSVPVDWEAMDSYVDEGVSYLVVADTGDNLRWRPNVELLIVAEPSDLATGEGMLELVRRVVFTFPEGARDIEALAVDIRAGYAYVLSKRTHPPELYRVPLRAGETVTAQRMGLLVGLPRPDELDFAQFDHPKWQNMPTGMDLWQSSLLVVTARHGYVYDLRDLQRKPLRVRMPAGGQREAISFGPSVSDTLYVTRERPDKKGVADVFKVEIDYRSR